MPKLDIPADTAIFEVSAPPPDHFLLLGKPVEMHRLDRVSAMGYPSSGVSEVLRRRPPPLLDLPLLLLREIALPEIVEPGCAVALEENVA
jgi:hypothetical protein